MKMSGKGFRWFRWLVWFWYAKVRRQPNVVCPPDCVLCEVQCRINDHWDSCAVCQADERECPTFKVLRVEEDAATLKLMPWLTDDLTTEPPTNGNTGTAVVLPPWDWSK